MDLQDETQNLKWNPKQGKGRKMKADARKAPEFLANSVVYQLFPRPFTTEGTLKGAEKMLPHLAGLGIDIVYLTPIVEADDDTNLEFWSPRQKASGLGNPKNPYRMKDYFKIDPEYGNDADLKHFVKAAHEFGLRVMLDLVYLHCGPKANLIAEHPDFVMRDENGNVKNGPWLFPALNFDNPNLREYLWGNMEYFIREFDIDGYRCDVASALPVDFWEEGRRRIEALKPDVIMLSEGERPDDQLHAFDFNYAFKCAYALQDVFLKGDSPRKLMDAWKKLFDAFPSGGRFIHYFESHDIVSDNGENRMEKLLGPDAVEAALAVIFALDGIPFLYNGQEIADETRHSIWGNRFYGKTFHINWENALTPVGQKRLDLVRELIDLRHSEEILTEGSLEWLESDRLIAFTRTLGDRTLLIAVNPSPKNMEEEFPLAAARVTGPEFLLERGAHLLQKDQQSKISLLPYGFFIAEI